VSKETAPLYKIIDETYEVHRLKPTVSPNMLAKEAMERIKFPRGLHELGWQAALLEFRQIARSRLRKRFDDAPIQEDDGQLELLDDGTLQDRYPLPPKDGEDPQYKLLDLLSEDELQYNITRLTQTGRARITHAITLQGYLDRRSGAAD
jgi:hypothetical protein